MVVARYFDRGVYADMPLRFVHDDIAILHALEDAWCKVRPQLNLKTRIARVSVTLLDLTLRSERQIDLLDNDDGQRRSWESITSAVDKLNGKYGRTLVSVGTWTPPPGGYAGGKISYTRIPCAEDFW